MNQFDETLKELGLRDNGEVYLGVVGPVRVGKSTFIKRFMEICVIPRIKNIDEQARAKDELPQSGNGRTVMTVEPKFVPSSAVSLSIDEKLSVNVRLIDCVGYLVEDAAGYLEDGKMRQVKTPWFSETIPFDEAARIGTQKVMKDHSTIGIVITTDGSINEFKREKIIGPEKEIIDDMKTFQKPFVIILNTKTPGSEMTQKLKMEMEGLYGTPVIPLDVENMSEQDITSMLKTALYEYPLTSIALSLPKWVDSLDENHHIKVSFNETIFETMQEIKKVKDVSKVVDKLKSNEYVRESSLVNVDTGSGIATVQVEVPDELYDVVLKELVGCEITDKSELIKVLVEFVKAKKDYDLIGNALKMADETGYGSTSSPANLMKIDKPITTKNGSRFGIKVSASAPTYHIFKVDATTAFEPILGSKEQSEYFLNYLMEAYEKSPTELLNCEMFGQKFAEILIGGLNMKTNNIPEPVKIKLQQIIKTLANRGRGNLIAFVF